MSEQIVSTAAYVPVGRIVGRSVAVAAIVVALAMGPVVFGHGAQYLSFAASHPLHAPDIGPVLRASPVIQAHLATVLAAVLTGIVLMSGVKVIDCIACLAGPGRAS